MNDPSQDVGVAPQIPMDGNVQEKAAAPEEGLMAKGT